MKRVSKGKAGYVRWEQFKRILITILMFAMPVGLYVIGIAVTGSNKNLLTVVAIVGVLPAARFAVSMIMILLQKPAPREIVDLTEKNAGDLTRGYELMVTAYEGRMPLDALVICGNNVACFSSSGEKSKFAFMEKHMMKTLSTAGFYSVKVKIFDETRAYADRLKTLAADPARYEANIKFEPDERYPDATREELILHTLMEISV